MTWRRRDVVSEVQGFIPSDRHNYVHGHRHLQSKEENNSRPSNHRTKSEQEHHLSQTLTFLPHDTLHWTAESSDTICFHERSNQKS